MPRAPRGSFLAAASTKLCGRQPLLVSRCCSSVATCCLPRAPRGSFLAAAYTKLCGRQPLLVSRCCSSVATCCLPAHSVCCLATAHTAVKRRHKATAMAQLQQPCWSGFKSALGQPQSPERFFKPLHFRSGPTDCLVEALRVPFAGLPSAQPSAAALHSTVLFKRLNPPQWRYTLSC